MENRVGAVEAGSVEVEERRKELEENENTGDEKINLLEEEVKEVSLCWRVSIVFFSGLLPILRIFVLYIVI